MLGAKLTIVNAQPYNSDGPLHIGQYPTISGLAWLGLIHRDSRGIKLISNSRCYTTDK
jgi:hypothetical protein